MNVNVNKRQLSLCWTTIGFDLGTPCLVPTRVCTSSSSPLWDTELPYTTLVTCNSAMLDSLTHRTACSKSCTMSPTHPGTAWLAAQILSNSSGVNLCLRTGREFTSVLLIRFLFRSLTPCSQLKSSRRRGGSARVNVSVAFSLFLLSLESGSLDKKLTSFFP